MDQHPERNRQSRAAATRALCLGLIGCSLGLGQAARQSAADRLTAAHQAVTESIAVGKPAKVRTTGSMVFVPADPDAEAQLMKFVGANDKAGVQELLSSKRLFMVQPGTSIMILDKHTEQVDQLVASTVRKLAQMESGPDSEAAAVIKAKFGADPKLKMLALTSLHVRILDGADRGKDGWVRGSQLHLPEQPIKAAFDRLPR
jgi:hypothetical protein